MTLIAPLVALLCAFSIAAQPEPVAWCGVAIRVTDADTRAPLPGAAVQFVHLSLTATSDAKGWVVWNVPNARENVWRQGRPFEVVATAPGYIADRRTFRAPAPPRCGCDEGMSLFSFEMPLRSTTSFAPPRVQPAEPIARDADDGWYSYDYVGCSEKRCCEGPTVICVDVVQGQPVATVDYTDKNRKSDKVTVKAEWKLGAALKDLGSFGFTGTGESSAEKEIVIDAKLGDRPLDPSLCGAVCIRKVVTVFRWERTYHVAGRAYPAGIRTLDVVTGTCVSAASLRRCDAPGEVDSCGQPRKTQ